MTRSLRTPESRSARRRALVAVGVVAAVLLVVGAAWTHFGRTDALAGAGDGEFAGGGAGTGRSVPVVLTPARRMVFEERLTVQGNVEAARTAVVPARLEGTLEAIYVDEGDPVTAGRTALFKTDSLKVEKSLEMSLQGLAVARCAQREKEASLERDQADLHKAETDYHRYAKLLAEGAVTQEAFEQQESRHLQAKATVKYAQSLVDLAVEQVRQAESAVSIARKDLADTVVYAPISGTVTQRYQEPGEMGTTSDPVLRIEDTSELEVSAFLPASYYGRVVPGVTRMRVRVNGDGIGDRILWYRAPSIDERLRTFEVKCSLTDPLDSVVPGAIAEIEVLLDRTEGVGVPVEALQQRKDGAVVFTVRKGAAHMVAVRTGIESDAWVEILDDALSADAPVITMGQDFVEDGTAVAVVSEDG